MCGRYSLTKADERKLLLRFLIERFSVVPKAPRFNIAPSQDILAITLEDDKRTLTTFKWGLVPSWVQDHKKAIPMINARMETLLEKAYFKQAFKERRCLIPADGFFEWDRGMGGKEKIPKYFQLIDHELFAFAGIWETWLSPNGNSINTCSIITVPASELVGEIHERMPAILTQEAESLWLDKDMSGAELLRLLRPYPVSLMEGYNVSSLVNSPKIDSIECLAPREEQLKLFS